MKVFISALRLFVATVLYFFLTSTNHRKAGGRRKHNHVLTWNLAETKVCTHVCIVLLQCMCFCDLLWLHIEFIPWNSVLYLRTATFGRFHGGKSQLSGKNDGCARITPLIFASAKTGYFDPTSQGDICAFPGEIFWTWDSLDRTAASDIKTFGLKLFIRVQTQPKGVQVPCVIRAAFQPVRTFLLFKFWLLWLQNWLLVSRRCLMKYSLFCCSCHSRYIETATCSQHQTCHIKMESPSWNFNLRRREQGSRTGGCTTFPATAFLFSYCLTKQSSAGIVNSVSLWLWAENETEPFREIDCLVLPTQCFTL